MGHTWAPRGHANHKSLSAEAEAVLADAEDSEDKKEGSLTRSRSGGRSWGGGVSFLVAVVLVGLRYLGLGDGCGRGLGLLLRPALQGQDAVM